MRLRPPARRKTRGQCSLPSGITIIIVGTGITTTIITIAGGVVTITITIIIIIGDMVRGPTGRLCAARRSSQSISPQSYHRAYQLSLDLRPRESSLDLLLRDSSGHPRGPPPRAGGRSRRRQSALTRPIGYPRRASTDSHKCGETAARVQLLPRPPSAPVRTPALQEGSGIARKARRDGKC